MAVDRLLVGRPEVGGAETFFALRSNQKASGVYPTPELRGTGRKELNS
jgi:hypothetical protein